MIEMFTDEKQTESAAVNNQSYESKYFKEEPKTVSSLKDIRGLV